MKKCLAWIFAVLLLGGLMQPVYAADRALIVASDTMRPVVVLPENAAAWQRKAAQILDDTLRQITGCAASSGQAAARIVLDDPSVQPPDAQDGAYRIEVRDGSVYISGAGMRGTLYGAFGFLEDVCACRWYTPELEEIPAADTVCVPAGYTAQYVPTFEYTETDWGSWRSNLFCTANRMDGAAYRGQIPDEWGGGVRYLGSFAHTLTTRFCKAETYFDAHPEYFALRQGKRVPDQLCLTNPDVLALVTDEVLQLLREAHDPEEALQIISLTQHDNQKYCTCSACAALDAENGSPSGSLLTFVNAVADAVKAAGYDNVAIDTFAYQYTRRPPTKVVPRENVIVRLCSIECCFGHALDDPDCAQNAAFMQDLRGWSEICRRIYIWDYGTNYRETFSFFPNLSVLQRNMQIYAAHHVRGIYGEGNYYIDRCDGEFGALRCYLQCRLQADPYMDFDREVNGFLRAYYGAGWRSVREFLDLCCEKGVSKTKHADIYQRAKGALPGMTADDVRRCDALWRMAYAFAGTPEERARVKRSELCWRYWKASNSRAEFSVWRPLRCLRARDALYHDLQSFGNTALGEGEDARRFSDCAAQYLLQIPIYWSKQYTHDFDRYISPAVEAVYRFLNRVFA